MSGDDVESTRPRDDSPPGLEPTAASLALAFRADAPLSPPSRHALEALDGVDIGRADEATCVRGPRLVLGLPDPWMSARHARLTRTWDRWRIEDLSSRNGTFVNGERITARPLDDGDVLEIGSAMFVFRSAEPVRAPLDGGVSPEDLLPSLRPHLWRLFDRLKAIARSGLSLVIVGESGVGKEVLARAIHAMSGRAGSFVGVNCGALPATLVESELFGFRKGAFSGATEDRLGLVRASHGGTLLLDELGDLAPAAQAALLRVLQEGEVLPVGATRPVAVDLRVVAATHRDLDAAVRAGSFRADLLARINAMTVHLPPLRERRDDLGLLVGATLRKHAPDPASVRFTYRAARSLFRHDWPGNVRELEQVLRSALVVAAAAPAIDEEALFPAERRSVAPPPVPPAAPSEDDERRRSLEALLVRHQGNVSAVARDLGKARAQVHRWIRAYGLETWRLRAPTEIDNR